MSTFLSKTLDF